MIPINIAPASITSLLFNCSLKNRGSRKVTNRGKVENVTSPTATLEIWMERKKLHQCIARRIPCKIKNKLVVFKDIDKAVFEINFA